MSLLASRVLVVPPRTIPENKADYYVRARRPSTSPDLAGKKIDTLVINKKFWEHAYKSMNMGNITEVKLEEMKPRKWLCSFTRKRMRPYFVIVKQSWTWCARQQTWWARQIQDLRPANGRPEAIQGRQWILQHVSMWRQISRSILHNCEVCARESRQRNEFDRWVDCGLGCDQFLLDLTGMHHIRREDPRPRNTCTLVVTSTWRDVKTLVLPHFVVKSKG